MNGPLTCNEALTLLLLLLHVARCTVRSPLQRLMAPNAANASAVPMLVQSADRLKMLLEGVQVPASGPPTGALTHRRVPTYRGRVSRSTVGWADTSAMQCGRGGAHPVLLEGMQRPRRVEPCITQHPPSTMRRRTKEHAAY